MQIFIYTILRENSINWKQRFLNLWNEQKLKENLLRSGLHFSGDKPSGEIEETFEESIMLVA
jgi:hypothetical protein